LVICLIPSLELLNSFCIFNQTCVLAGYSGFVSCLDGVEVVGYVGEDHKPGVSLYALICFIYGQHAIHLNKMEKSARRDAVCHCLAKFFDSQEALEVI